MPNQIAYPGATSPGRQNPTSQGGGTVVNVPSGNGQAEAPVALIPFSRASKLRIDSGRQLTGTIAAATSQLSFTPLPTTGYLAAIYLVVVATASGNSATVAFQADAPWSFFQNILFRDATGIPIVNMFTGYQLYEASKLGGYRLGRPEGSSYINLGTTGAGGSGGSFTFVMPIYQEFGRDTLGPLANMDASAGYQLDLTIAASASIYSTAPTVLPPFTISLYMESYTNPPDMVEGNQARTQPPALGSTQFWTAQNYSWSGTGEQTVQIVRVGNLIRNMILVWRNASGARSAAVLPTSNIRFELDQAYLMNNSILLNQFLMYRYYTYDLDTGVTLYGFQFDPDNLPTGEYGDRWLQTLAQTRVALVFTPAAAGALEILINDIAPVGDVYRLEG